MQSECDNDGMFCSKCEIELLRESDIFPYEEMEVCQECYDRLSQQDELEYQRWEGEGMFDYDE